MESNDLGLGDFGVLLFEHYALQISEEVEIALRIWFPISALYLEKYEQKVSVIQRQLNQTGHILRKPLQNSKQKEEKFPAILEYLPYRKSDHTLFRDARRMPWFCSHGYVCVRADIRGSGDSTGYYHDEYSQSELTDGVTIVNWIGTRNWSNGTVGMYGKSWGGFNGLQLAALQPKCLKAVISTYSTDDRYADDAHYLGGCLMGSQMLSWATVMLAWNARPPSPNLPKYHKDNESFPSVWLNEWKDRLEKSLQPWINIWTSHQYRDAYWCHGSICETPSKLDCPVLLVGGWQDGYVSTVFRMIEILPNVKAVIGPWSHKWPDIAIPKPNMYFLDKCLEFYNTYLGVGRKDKKLEKPHISLFLQNTTYPNDTRVKCDGNWIDLPGYLKDNTRKVNFYISENHRLCIETSDIVTHQFYNLKFDSIGGFNYSEWMSFGQPDQADDQRAVDKLWECFDTEPLKEDLAVLGIPKVECVFSRAAVDGQIAARICEILPNGTSVLKSFGVINLTHINGHDEPNVHNLQPNCVYKAVISMKAIGFKFSKGNRIRLSFSTSYFPMTWPSKSDHGQQIETKLYTCNRIINQAGEPEMIQTRLILNKLENWADFKTHDEMFNEPPKPHLAQEYDLIEKDDLTIPKFSRKLYTNAETGDQKMVVENAFGSAFGFYSYDKTKHYQKAEDKQIFQLIKDKNKNLLKTRVQSDMKIVMKWDNINNKKNCDAQIVSIVVSSSVETNANDDFFKIESNVNTFGHPDFNFKKKWIDRVEWK